MFYRNVAKLFSSEDITERHEKPGEKTDGCSSKILFLPMFVSLTFGLVYLFVVFVCLLSSKVGYPSILHEYQDTAR